MTEHIVGDTGGIGTRAINTNYPITDGLTAGTTKLPEKWHLEAEETFVDDNDKVGMVG